MPTEFTPIAALVGGALIGLSATLLLAFNGRIAGISGIVNGLLARAADDRGWRALFLVGLVAGAGLFFGWGDRLGGVVTTARSGTSPMLLAAAGLLVGLGTRLGGGCTSGHGICGLSRLSKRSMVAVAVFMVAGFATVGITRHLLP